MAEKIEGERVVHVPLLSQELINSSRSCRNGELHTGHGAVREGS